MKLDFSKLCNIIFIVLKSRNLSSLSDSAGPTNNLDQSSIWYEVSRYHYGLTTNVYSKAMSIYGWYKKKNKNKVDSKISSMFDEQIAATQAVEREQNIAMSVDTPCQTVFLKINTDIARYIISKNTYKRMSTEFFDLLSDILQTRGYNCRLRAKGSNHINETPKKKCAYWRGTLKCMSAGCSTNLIAEIHHTDKQLAHISFKEYNCHLHSKLLKKIRTTGERREQLATQLRAHGIDVLRDRYIIENIHRSDNDQLPTSRNYLKFVKHEAIRSGKMSSSYTADAIASFKWSNKTGLDLGGYLGRGLIRELGMEPFGFILLSSIQVAMWCKIKERFPIWYFDATGNIHNRIPDQKKPFLYSIVMHDQNNKVILPIAEFITTSHTEDNIGRYLSTLLSQMRREKDDHFPSIIVTDMSMALINAVMATMCKLSFDDYLKWCFEVAMDPSSSNISKHSVIYCVCNVHFIRIILRKVKTTLSTCSKEASNVYKFSITLMQQSISLDGFVDVFKHFYIVFMSKYSTQNVKHSLESLKSMVVLRNIELAKLEEELVDKPYEQQRQNMKEYLVSNDSSPKKGGLKTNSPFRKYLCDVVKTINSTITIEPEPAVIQKNSLYYPEFYKAIEDYLFSLPIWTGIMLKIKRPDLKINRISNNPVENYFGQLKKRYSNRKLSTSELVIDRQTALVSKFMQLYQETANMIKRNTTDIKETWKKNETFTREKGFLYMNHANFGLAQICPSSIESSLPDTSASSHTCDNSSIQLNKGLKNLGNSCYINAALQILFNNHEFVDRLFESWRSKGSAKDSSNLTSYMCNFIITKDQYYIASIKKLIGSQDSRFNNDEQQDSSELLFLLLDTIEQENIVIRPTSLYTFEMMASLECSRCEHVSLKAEIFNSISLTVTESANSIQSLLDNYFEEDKLSFKCGECNHDNEVHKHSIVLEYPLYLIILLKRTIFVSSSNSMSNIQITHKNRAQMILDPFLTLDHKTYNIKSIITHVGPSHLCGHYKTFVLIENQWICFDDEQVYQVLGPVSELEEDSYLITYQLAA